MAESGEQGSESAKPDPLPQVSGAAAAYSLTVYVTQRDGATHARAANLAGYSCTAGDERAALQQLLKQVKEYVKRCVAEGESIEWLDPPADRQDDEQQRIIPFHL